VPHRRADGAPLDWWIERDCGQRPRQRHQARLAPRVLMAAPHGCPRPSLLTRSVPTTSAAVNWNKSVLSI